MIPIRDHNPAHRPPIVTVAILVACVVAYLWQVSAGPVDGEQIVFSLGFIPAVLFDYARLPEAWHRIPAELTIFSSMFLHGGFMHLAGNMLYLWIFGNNVEDSMGHVKFLLFYLLCGVVAAMAQALPNPQSEVPMIGASGAISGVLGGYLLMYPHAKVNVIIPPFYFSDFALSARWVLLFWFGMQIFSAVASSGAEAGVAFGAHVGGFVAGLLLIAFFRDRNIPLHNPLR